MTRANATLAVLVSIALVASAGLLAAGGFVGAQAQEEVAAVSIVDQASDGQTVIVANVTVPDGGFVVIHESDDLEAGDVVESVVGVSSYLEPGTHEDVPVTLGQELDTTEVNVTAMAHQDTNGNEVFDFVTADGEADGAYTTGGAPETEAETTTGTPNETETATGTPNETETETSTESPTVTTEESVPVTDTATIDAIGDGAPATNLEFSDQPANGSAVTVDRVTLYRGGYVVIHDTEGLGDGDAIGSVLGHSEYLPPGTYEDVNITLAEPVAPGNESGVNVTAMPHHETNENLVFDFVISLGDADGAYIENGTAVTEAATLTADQPNGPETETGTSTETDTETENGTATETTAANETATTDTGGS